MPIIEVNGPNPAVSINGNQLFIQSFMMEGVEIPGQSFDLTEFQSHKPRTVRIFAGKDGHYYTTANQELYWLVAEANIPAIRYESVPAGQDMEQVIVTPNLEQEAEIRVWALPEGGN